MMPLLYRMYSKAWLGRPLQEAHTGEPRWSHPDGQRWGLQGWSLCDIRPDLAHWVLAGHALVAEEVS